MVILTKDVSSNGSVGSADEELSENDLNNSQTRITLNRRSFGRVSFELQSSDGESYNNSNSSNNPSERCVDTLSAQRLSLLNLIQLAKLKLEKLSLFSPYHASHIIEKINRIEQQSHKDAARLG